MGLCYIYKCLHTSTKERFCSFQIKKLKKLEQNTQKSWKTPHFSNTRDANQREYAITEYRTYFLLVDKMDASLVTVLPDLLLAISGLLNFRNSLSLEKWKPQTKSLVRQATRKQQLTVVKCHRVCESRSRLQVGFAFVDVGFRKNYNSAFTVSDSLLGNVMW